MKFLAVRFEVVNDTTDYYYHADAGRTSPPEVIRRFLRSANGSARAPLLALLQKVSTRALRELGNGFEEELVELGQGSEIVWGGELLGAGFAEVAQRTT